jgi:hypothetical protein
VIGEWGVSGGPHPSLGEITNRAFGICTEEFHNELYGIVTAHLSDPESGQPPAEKTIDTYLASKGLAQELTWTRPTGMSYSATLPVYTRNTIHHPENGKNTPFTQEQLEESTTALLRIINKIRVTTGPAQAETVEAEPVS